MAVVKVDLDQGHRMTASVTKDAVEDLGITVGSQGDLLGQVDRGDARRRIANISASTAIATTGGLRADVEAGRAVTPLAGLDTAISQPLSRCSEDRPSAPR